MTTAAGTPMTANLVVLVLALLTAAGLAHPRLRRAPTWRATVTPLASIIGSGFLVLAPLLVREFGHHAVFVMAGLCGVAYLVGAAIRSNIVQRADEGEPTGAVAWLESASRWALVFAYVLSVCYYLNLFGAFAFSLVWPDSAWAARWLTSGMLVAIAVLGWARGLAGLERAESLSVGLKLAVIAGLLGGMAYYTGGLYEQGRLQHRGGHFDLDALRLCFGLLVTVQGFETSRYLREAYDAPMRVRTMRYAQWLSTAIYLAYIGLAGLDFDASAVPLQETAVIGMTAVVATSLPMLLVVAALAAQFSAAVADTNGCGGLVQEMSRERISSRQAYLGLAVLALLLTWTADIFEIISYASRAFAVYYALQCAVASAGRWQAADRVRGLAYAALALLMLAAAVFGVPAE
jgi:hypothetical protein